MLDSYAIEGGALVHCPPEAARIFVFSSPDEAERRALVRDYGLDPHELASALDPDELGRVDHDETRFSIILKRPCNFTGEDQLLFTVTSLGLFLEKDRLLVVASDSLGLFENRAVRRIDDPRDALLKILYGTIAHFLGHLKVINMLSESIEKRINTSMENRYLLDMFTLEKSLVYFVNGIDSNQMVLEKMRQAGERLGLSRPQLDILEEILIENRQCSKQAEIYSNILTGLMDARGSVVNNNLSVLMKRLTVISVVFMPMNVLAGMGGMSEFSQWTRGAPWWVAYSLFLAGLVMVGFLTYWVLKKTGLERSGGGRREPEGRRRRKA